MSVARSAAALASSFGDLDRLMSASEEELAAVEDIGGVIATSLVRYFASEGDLAMIERLRSAVSGSELPCGRQLPQSWSASPSSSPARSAASAVSRQKPPSPAAEEVARVGLREDNGRSRRRQPGRREAGQGRGARNPGSSTRRNSSSSWSRGAALDTRAGALHRSRAANRYPFVIPMSSAVEQVGRVIGGRYRLLAVVGAGASAQVFAADDTRLGRRVAVKLLHPALAGDATFLRKFQAEARLAASLNHRNVLHVYDWGDEKAFPTSCSSTSAAGACGPCWTPGVCSARNRRLRSAPRLPTGSRTRTGEGSSTVTSSRPTFSSTTTGASLWPISALPAALAEAAITEAARRGHGDGPIRLARTGRGPAGR